MPKLIEILNEESRKRLEELRKQLGCAEEPPKEEGDVSKFTSALDKLIEELKK